MDILARYIHGSEDSTDLDVIYIVDGIPEAQACPLFCNDNPSENRNIAVIKDGIVTWCYKGFADEVNNSVLSTYPLHSQEYDLLITRSVPRDIPIKLLAVLRKSVMELRHTTLRKEARSVLRNGFAGRVRLLESTDLRQLEWTVSNNDRIDRIKSLAFQLGQAVSLNDGVELYTKKDLALYMPELRPYLYRESCTMDDLEDIKNRFVRIISEKDFEDCGNMTVKFPGPPVRYIDLKGKEQDVTED